MGIDWFINPSDKKEKQTKTRIFVYVSLFAMLNLFGIYLIDYVGGIESDFPFLSFAIGIGIMLLLFKITNSFFAVGNIFAAALCFVLFKLGLETGGIFSEDIHCLYIVPLIAFLIVGPRSGFFWLFITICLTVYTFIIADTPEHIAVFRNQTHEFPKVYYLMICFVNLILTSSFLTIFHLQYKKLIRKFKRNQNDLEQQAKQLKEIEQKLLTSNAALDQYAYTTAHDLKQPIRTIHSFTGLLAKELNSENPRVDKKEEYLEIIQKSSSNMNQMVSDLLEYSTLSNIGNSNNKLVDISLVIDNVTTNLKDLINSTGTKITIEPMPTLKGNQVQLNQLFLNLIYNALKFRSKERSPEILISHKPKNDFHHFIIKDNGIGIAKKNLSEIFSPFKKLHSQRDFEGSGIGLATCKKIIELHDGKIWAESKLDMGTSFHFTISKHLT